MYIFLLHTIKATKLTCLVVFTFLGWVVIRIIFTNAENRDKINLPRSDILAY